MGDFDGRDRRSRGKREALPSSPFVALEFLTILRLRAPATVSGVHVAAAQAWYPLVGLLIGLGIAGLDRAVGSHLPPAPAAVLVLIALEGVSGFLHIDGLADAADGLLGLQTRERRLEIMRDSRVGSFGVAAIGLYLLLMSATISSLSGASRGVALVLMPVVGRGAIVVLAATFPYARPEGLGLDFHDAARGWPGRIAVVVLAATVLLAWGPVGFISATAGLIAGLLVGALAHRQIGGLSGDVFGGGCALAQAVFLTVACVVQGHAWARPWLLP